VHIQGRKGKRKKERKKGQRKKEGGRGGQAGATGQPEVDAAGGPGGQWAQGGVDESGVMKVGVVVLEKCEGGDQRVGFQKPWRS